MRNISRITPCCKPPIERINSMPADCNGDFTVKQGNGIKVTVETNGIRIDNTFPGSPMNPYTNNDGNLNINNSDFEIDLSNDIDIAGDLEVHGDVTIDSDLNITGDIYQQGSSYETHAEQVYTTKDYIITRDGAVTGLATGDYSGFEVENYDGSNNNCRLVVDKTGTARVGDTGGEQPLLTREESAFMTDGKPIIWDSNNQRAETANVTLAKIIKGSATLDNTSWTQVDTNMYSKKVNVTGMTPSDFVLVSFTDEDIAHLAYPYGVADNNGFLIYMTSVPTTTELDYTVIQGM